MAVYKQIEYNKLTNIDFHLINKCNLNCIACGHLCPLVENEEMMSFDIIKDQLITLSNLVKRGKFLQTLTLTGGEITLRPDLFQIVETACDLFDCEIRIWSNGILYKKLIALKPLLMKYDNLKLFITDYKQAFTHKAEEELNKEIPNLFLIEKENRDNDVYFNYQFFDKNEVATDEEILDCTARKYCNQLVNYKLYVCQYLAYFKYFDKKFKGIHKIPWDPEKGYIDIRKVDNIQQIISFINNFNDDFCKHCLDCKWCDRNVIKWTISKKNINEWYKR